jgi:hypothetical protein
MAPRLCVVHLVRAANGRAPLRAFLESYRRYGAGMEHELLMLLKGFEEFLPAEYEDLLKSVPHRRRFVPDCGFDIDAYFDTARANEATWFCFMNSYSVILDEGWLAKLHRALTEHGAGAVGATGSWQSIFSNILDNMALPLSFQVSYPPWKRVLLRCFPFLRTLWRPIRRRMLRGMFDPFPNYHLRTNAFLIPRDVALRIDVGAMRKKFDAYQFESGTRGLTRQILQMGRRVMVVGRDGRAYDMERWHLSNTFWRRDQENLLVADNQTRKYDRSDPQARAVYSAYAWGPEADPQLDNGRAP